jgi:uncharacterized protein (TIGR00730 family)
MKNICVFLAANDLNDKYIKPTQELGKLLAQNGYGFVYGGSDKGLMKVMADAVQTTGGKVIGISTEMFRKQCKKDADEMIITKDLHERKTIMNERSDAFIVMVGGIGTLDEVMELMELKKHGVHNKPIIILNTEQFYKGFKIQLQKMESEGCLPKKLDDIIFFADTPEQIIAYLHKTLI